MLLLLSELYKYATHTTDFCPSHWKNLSVYVFLGPSIVRTQKNTGLRLTLASSRRKRFLKTSEPEWCNCGVPIW